MATTAKDLDLLPFIDGSQLLSALFGEQVLKYSFDYAIPCPARLRPALEALKCFEEWTEAAMRGGNLEADEIGGTFYLHVWGKVNLYRWMHNNGILGRLEEKGVTISDALKDAIEATATTEPTQPEPGQIDKFLPAPAGTNWKDISIKVTKDARIELKVNRKTKLYDLEKFKKDIITQKKAREYLFLIIESGGTFTRDDIAPGEDKNIFRTNVSRLRDSLKKVFGIDAEPLPFQNNKYKAQFSVSSSYQAQQ